MLVDSHAHIQLDNYRTDRDAVLTRARQAGVHAILVIGFDLQTSRDGIALAESHAGLYATVGIHPHDAKDFEEETLDIFRELASHSKVMALGEMGLDYYRNLSPSALQKNCIRAATGFGGRIGSARCHSQPRGVSRHSSNPEGERWTSSRSDALFLGGCGYYAANLGSRFFGRDWRTGDLS